MRIRRKPAKPTRQMIGRVEYVSGFAQTTLEGFIEELKKYPSDARVENTWEDTEIRWKEPESDEVFNARIEKYEKALKDYEEWYEENKEAVKEELRRRSDKKREEIERRKRALLKEVEELEKQL